MKKTAFWTVSLAFCLAAGGVAAQSALASPHPAPQAASPSQGSSISFLGTVQSISGTELSVKNSSGALMQVEVGQDARVLRIEPGEKSLQSAVKIPLSSIAVGDRVLARGTTSSGGKQLQASLLVAIKQSDILEKQAQEREDWEKHGVGGLVASVDSAAGTVTLKRSGKPPLVIQTSSATVLRRYAPGSFQFDQAKPAPISSIKPGDELRARGAPVEGSNGDRFAAVEIVSGTFRNIAGPIVSVDPSASRLTVIDIASKHPVTVEVTPSTQVKKLNASVAGEIAADLRRASAKKKKKAPQSQQSQPGFDPHALLSQAPAVPLSSFTKGEDVMMVATEAGNGAATAVTVVGGVKPMLDASAAGSQAILSSAWNLGGSPSTDTGGGTGGGGSDQGQR